MTLKISRILHAGYVFECEETRIICDPIFENPFSRNCFAYPAVQFDQHEIRNQQFDAIFISHYHDDHCSFESLDLLDRQTPIYVYCVFEELFAMLKELGFAQVHSLDLNIPVQIGTIEITPRRALDADVDSLFQIKAGDVNVLNVVDSWIDESTLQLLTRNGPWDMVLWPFQTMREIEVIAPLRASPAICALPEEWIPQLKALNPRFVVPSSCQFIFEDWSWLNHAFFPITYHQFQSEIESALPNIKVVRLNPSVSVELSKESLRPAPPLSWIHPVGEQNVDYDFQSELQPMKTSEVAQKFLPLSAEQTARVWSYCEVGLADQYNLLEEARPSDFALPGLWRLSVFDAHGEARHYCYEIQKGCLQITESFTAPIAWTTEIPISRLFAALEFGESLTSLYLRVNDFAFEAGIESEMASLEVMADPLLRCLYEGAFGGYQRAQMRLMSSCRKI